MGKKWFWPKKRWTKTYFAWRIVFRWRHYKGNRPSYPPLSLLLMAEILHQLRLAGSLSHYLQGFIHPWCWFGISEPSTVSPIPPLSLGPDPIASRDDSNWVLHLSPKICVILHWCACLQQIFFYRIWYACSHLYSGDPPPRDQSWLPGLWICTNSSALVSLWSFTLL